MAYIGKTPVIGNFQICDAITVVDAQAAYTMQVGGVNVSPESANHMLVSLNGILQAPTSSFTVSGSTITFASNLVTGDVIDFIQILGNVLDLGVPSDNTVTTAKLADSSVSLAKLTATGTKDATTFLRGDNTFAEAGGGKVLQVLTATDSTQRTTTSTSFVTASNTLSVDITPSAASSKVLIMISTVIGNNTEEAQAISTIYRDSTNLGDSTKGMLDTYHFGGTTRQSASLIFLDSPSSTSQLTYQLYVRGTGGTTEINYNGGKGSIIVMEIGA
jgi:hypothetical protein